MLELINRKLIEWDSFPNDFAECYPDFAHKRNIDNMKSINIYDETILSLRAVLHGCRTNNKCKCGYFAYDIKNPHNFPMISFEQAINNVANLIIELTELTEKR